MGLNQLNVIPGYQLGATEVLTVSILNQMAKPTVQVSLDNPFNDQNYFRNGNFYSAYWNTPLGVNCPAGSQTLNANYWFCQPNGSGNVNYLQSTNTPDVQSLYSARLTGATGITDVLFGQQIGPDLSATLRRTDAFSGWIYNGTSSAFTPTVQVATANASGNFTTVTIQAELTLPSCAPGAWTYVTFAQDLSIYTNVSNGLQLSFHIPTGVLNSSSNYVLFSRLKCQTGTVATSFADDVSLFVSAPVIQTANIANGAVTGTKIAALTVTGGTPNGNLSPNTIVGGNALNVTVNTTISSAALTIPDPSGNIFPLLSNGMYISSANLPVNATITGLATAGGNITCNLVSGTATATASGTAAVIGAGNFAPGTPETFPWLATNPLNLPATWTQYDDEFDGSSIKSKWTVTSSGANNTASVGGSRLSLQDGSTAGFYQLQQPVTFSGSWQFTAEVDYWTALIFSATVDPPSVFVGMYGTSKSLCLRLQLHTTSSNNWAACMTAANGTQSTGGTPIAGATSLVTPTMPRFVRFGYDGTNLYLSASIDGVNFVQVYSEVYASGPSFTGAAITGVMLGFYAGTSGFAQASFDYIRKTI